MTDPLRPVLPEPEVNDSPGQLARGQLLGRSIGIVLLSLVGGLVAWIVPTIAIVFLFFRDNGTEDGSGLAILAIGVLLFYVAGSIGYLLTGRALIRRWIPVGQRTIPWVCMFGFIGLIVVAVAILISGA